MTDELARLIEEAPDDVESYRVYADWLEERGDPRATLIRLMMTKARLTDRAKLDHLENRLAEHFVLHREQFLGPLAKVMPKALFPSDGPQLEWRNGFIYKAELARIKRMPMHQFLEHLLTHPSGRFLVELCRIWAEDPEALVSVLAAHAPRSLRRLEISGTDGARVTSIAPIWQRLDRLEGLEVSAVAGLGDIALPNLRRASFDISDPLLLASLATARWPNLEHLRLRIWPETATPDQVSAVFDNELPSLRSVDLGFDHPAPAVLPTLAKLPRLAELDVRLSEEILDALEPCTFHLEVLRINGIRYPDPRPRLRHLAQRIEMM